MNRNNKTTNDTMLKELDAYMDLHEIESKLGDIIYRYSTYIIADTGRGCGDDGVCTEIYLLQLIRELIREQNPANKAA